MRFHRRGGCIGGCVNGAIEDEAVALVVVGAAAVLGDVEVVDRGAEEELADVVDGLRPVCRRCDSSPARGALRKETERPS